MRFGFGLVAALCLALVDIRLIARLSWVAYAGTAVLLVLVLRMGTVGKGAQRWIELGGLQWQPSELAKITLCMALASWFHRTSWERMGNPLFLLLPAVAVLVPVGLILKQPNLGTAVITAFVGEAALGEGEGVFGGAVAVALVGFGKLITAQHQPDAQRVKNKRHDNGLDDRGHLGIVQVVPTKMQGE